jgi:hypothetical protein
MHKPLRLSILAAALAASALLLMAPAASAAVAPGTYPAVFNDANAPSGTHVQKSTASCVVGNDLSVTCGPYSLGGVGNTNATASLTATYTGTVDCYNKGTNPNNPIESHETTFSPTDSDQVFPGRNGQLRVPQESVSPGSVGQVCPNPNWRPVLRDVTLVSFTYTLTFDGFTGAYITIKQPVS